MQCRDGHVALEVEVFMVSCEMVEVIDRAKKRKIPIDAACDRLAELERLHMFGFVRVYGPGAVKPKLHRCLHISRILTRLRMVIGQFVVERLHHANKAAAQQINNVSTFDKTMMEAGLTKKFTDLNSLASGTS